MKFLVVGAGFAGATYARLLADAGHQVLVIDQRDHIGGNCYDYCNSEGVRVHRYGPHIFHTSNARVFDWLSQHTDWLPYQHKVVAQLTDGRLVPMPVNLSTLESVFGVRLETEEDARDLLKDKALNIKKPGNAAEYLYSQIGEYVSDMFFRRYTKKMWNLDLEQIDVSVVQRIPIRFDREDRYFPDDKFQYMPANGYTKIFESLLDHPNIRVELSKKFNHSQTTSFDHVFNSMPIDVYFDNIHGELPYRSIRFHTRTLSKQEDFNHVTINFTDELPYTRVTCWNNFPGQPSQASKVTTTEEPCDYRDNNFERYYPVRRSDNHNQIIYNKYVEEAEKIQNITFIGRCGTYQYLDMHQVINQSLIGAEKFLKRL